MKKYNFPLFFLFVMTVFGLQAQGFRRLSLPSRELLSSYRILYVMQDSEGFLWYATEGSGLCRDDGRQTDVFRSDAQHPGLLCSNDVVCLAESGNRILIGTTHGANFLDKTDYSIRQLTEVDDKRVDDIIITADGHWWFTANKKVWEFSAEGQLLRTFDLGDKYIFRMYEDEMHRLWCREWEGGTLCLDSGKFVKVTTEWPDSIDFRRVTKDQNGCLLVADGFGDCYALCGHNSEPWFKGTVLSKEQAYEIRQTLKLSSRPTALVFLTDDECWFSTGKDIRRKKGNTEEIVVTDTKDVSAMAFTPDGTLWMGTIFGQLYRYLNGKTETDAYGSNEYGDAVTAMQVDSAGQLILVYDRYVRIYNTRQKTLRQQSREKENTYCIELQETAPGQRWSHPLRIKVVEQLPDWLWWILGALMLVVSLLMAHIVMLRRQRKRFLDTMKQENKDNGQPAAKPSVLTDTWLQKAIAQVEANISDDSYTVEQLSNDLCMSRMTFYRKIQSLTGQTPTEFVRTIRLRRAAELLREGRLTVSEIGYMTGFSSVSYFSRCFRSLYGVPPTQFNAR